MAGSLKTARQAVAALLAALLIAGAAAPVAAHEEHRKQREAAMKAEQLRRQQAAAQAAPTAASADPMAAHAGMGEMMAPVRVDRSAMSPVERLLDWLGRLHPVIVHFPIAFFPAALFTALVGRRRPAYARPVQFLVVAGGLLAPIAALLGWLDGGFVLASDDALLAVHRWLGSAVGLAGLVLAIWAIRRPDQDRSPAMIGALAMITAAIIVQGWYGGALVHGAEHMNW